MSTRRDQYVEVYNNADTTVYLDGKILASAFWYVWESSLDETSLDNCEEFRRWRLDPEGIWSEWHLRFPGSGREYALTPGQARLVAMQAIDHREVAPELGFPDLSQADFEVVGTGQDVDNPAVPNMEDVGLRPSVDALGRGFLSLEPAIMIVDNVDLESLPVDELPLFASGLPPVSRRSAPRPRRPPPRSCDGGLGSARLRSAGE